jgi:hypothetical protein
MPSLPITDMEGKRTFYKHIQVHPEVFKALRFIIAATFLPVFALAMPWTFTHPFGGRFIGIFPSLLVAGISVYLLRQKKPRYTLPVFALDFVAFAWLTLVLAYHIRNFQYFYGYRQSMTFYTVCVLWSFPVIAQLILMLYFLVAYGFDTVLVAIKSKSWHYVCPHCHKTTSTPSITTKTHDGSRYSLLQPEADEYQEHDEDTRRSTGGDDV